MSAPDQRDLRLVSVEYNFSDLLVQENNLLVPNLITYNGIRYVVHPDDFEKTKRLLERDGSPGSV